MPAKSVRECARELSAETEKRLTALRGELLQALTCIGGVAGLDTHKAQEILRCAVRLGAAGREELQERLDILRTAYSEQTDRAVAGAKQFSEKFLECKELESRLARVTEALNQIARKAPIMGSKDAYRDGQLHALEWCRDVAQEALADAPDDRVLVPIATLRRWATAFPVLRDILSTAKFAGPEIASIANNMDVEIRAMLAASEPKP